MTKPLEIVQPVSYPDEETETAPVPRLFLLDDDPIFCKLMAKVAKRMAIPIAICTRLSELGTSPSHRDFDVAVLDYYVEDLKGSEIAYLLDDKPVLLVSRTESCLADDRRWPDCVKQFIPKKLGPQAILEAAVNLGRAPE